MDGDKLHYRQAGLSKSRKQKNQESWRQKPRNLFSVKTPCPPTIKRWRTPSRKDKATMQTTTRMLINRWEESKICRYFAISKLSQIYSKRTRRMKKSAKNGTKKLNSKKSQLKKSKSGFYKTWKTERPVRRKKLRKMFVKFVRSLFLQLKMLLRYSPWECAVISITWSVSILGLQHASRTSNSLSSVPSLNASYPSRCQIWETYWRWSKWIAVKSLSGKRSEIKTLACSSAPQSNATTCFSKSRRTKHTITVHCAEWSTVYSVTWLTMLSKHVKKSRKPKDRPCFRPRLMISTRETWWKTNNSRSGLIVLEPNSARGVNSGFRKVKGATTWHADVVTSSAIRVEANTRRANVEVGMIMALIWTTELASYLATSAWMHSNWLVCLSFVFLGRPGVRPVIRPRPIPRPIPRPRPRYWVKLGNYFPDLRQIEEIMDILRRRRDEWKSSIFASILFVCSSMKWGYLLVPQIFKIII